MPFRAEVVLDSIGPWGHRLTTMEFTLPKLWLAEFNTHCMFARNSASTRAIPYRKQREKLLADSFIPFEWPIEAKGMAHIESEKDPAQVHVLEKLWIAARDEALRFSDSLTGPYQPNPIHKQLAGRLLEPWQYQTILVTGDRASYSNFFHLRRSSAAAPEIHRAADLMWWSYKKSVPQQLKEGQWHTPLILENEVSSNCDWRRVSAARCARLSYLTHHGIRDVTEDFSLFRKLTENGHWSPLEHVCQAMPNPRWYISILSKLPGLQLKRYGKWEGWRSFRNTFPNEYIKEYGNEN